jgi:Ca2+-transporting ATPase
MPGKVIHIGDIKGLREADIASLQQQYAKNSFPADKPRTLLRILTDMVREPMFILLVVACVLYFVLAQPAEGILMGVAMLLVAAISVYQDMRSTRALLALKEFTAPQVTVIRDGIEKSIRPEDLVPGDVLLLEEGNRVPADATVLQENDLTVNESIITGESFPAEKHETPGNNTLYQGTTINSGSCYAVVTTTGNRTQLGRLGKSVSGYTAPKTLLQQQVSRFVRRLAFFGISAFVVIWIVNYYHSAQAAQSFLYALTLAMAAIPEEIPVAFTSFMALGAWHMSKLGIISRQPQTIENLGAVSVICLDKTGTITENKMTVKSIYDYETDTLADVLSVSPTSSVLGYAMLASENRPFDAMEIAIHEAYHQYGAQGTFESLQQVYEYPLEGRPPMMTHVYRHDHHYTVAAKGGAERILQICNPDDNTTRKMTAFIKTEAQKGYRLIGVASAIHPHSMLPARQEAFNWKLEGFISLYDPPKQHIGAVIKRFYDARIEVKLLTGDYPETAINIAAQCGIDGYLKCLTGTEVLNMKEHELKKAVEQFTMFARMFPEAKMRVIQTLQSNGHIVAMTGDGVNDAPALKAADIGIAMGKRGTEMARQAADLVITDDDLQKVTEAIRHGRTIFSNLKKAVRYIISIHIPIILTASLPLLFGWKYPNIFSPVHVIFLELIMGPTCSVFFEREPVEKELMRQPPRNRNTGLFVFNELLISIVQGLMITAGVLGLYYYAMHNGASLSETRTLVFTTLLIANVLLTFANRSFTENFATTIQYRNNLAPWLLLVSLLFLVVIHVVPPVRELFGMAAVPFTTVLLCAGVALVSVGWFELYKTRPLQPRRST